MTKITFSMVRAKWCEGCRRSLNFQNLKEIFEKNNGNPCPACDYYKGGKCSVYQEMLKSKPKPSESSSLIDSKSPNELKIVFREAQEILGCSEETISNTIKKIIKMNGDALLGEDLLNILRGKFPGERCGVNMEKLCDAIIEDV